MFQEYAKILNSLPDGTLEEVIDFMTDIRKRSISEIVECSMGGMVVVKTTLDGQLKSIKLVEEHIKPENKVLLEDLTLSAVKASYEMARDAMDQLKEELAVYMSNVIKNTQLSNHNCEGCENQDECHGGHDVDPELN